MITLLVIAVLWLYVCGGVMSYSVLTGEGMEPLPSLGIAWSWPVAFPAIVLLSLIS